MYLLCGAKWGDECNVINLFLFKATTNGLHYSVSVPSLGGQFSLFAEPDDLVSQVKDKILSMLATYNAPEARRRTSSNLGIKFEELELFLSPPHGGDNGTWLEDDRSLMSYLIGPGCVCYCFH